MSVKFSINFKKVKRLKRNDLPLKGEGLSLKGNNGCTAILIHGLTGTPYEMWTLAKTLNKIGYSVICPLLANHGESIEILKKTTWQECYQIVKEIFLKIKSSNKNEVVFAAGLSVGALFALLLAEEFKDKISGISCLAPTLFYDGWNMPWTRIFLPLGYFTPLRNFFYFKEEPPYGIKNEAIRDRVHRYYAQASLSDTENAIQYGYPYIPVTLLYQHYLLVKYLKKRLHRINTPIQLIQAKHDDIASIKNSQLIYDNIDSTTKEMILLDNSYHVITADQERDKVAQAIEKFFTHVKNNLKR